MFRFVVVVVVVVVSIVRMRALIAGCHTKSVQIISHKKK